MSLDFKLMVLNAQDLYLFMDKHKGEALHEMNEIKWQLMSSSLYANKSKEKCLQIAQTIKECGADIVMMTEVGGTESLHNFAKFILQDEYFALSLPSNSDRGIDLGYLVRKDFPLSFSLHSYLNFPLPDPKRKFSRDVLRLDFFEGDHLKFILLLVHIKSKLDLKKSDFEGRTQRSLEIKGLVNIYKELSSLNVPIFIGGDFNGNASEKETEEEFLPLYKETNLKDISFLAQIPEELRFSYIYFSRSGQRVVQQIDYLFLSEQYRQLIDLKECYFPRYKNLEGGPLPLPKRVEHKSLQPSDHFPFIASIKM